MRAMLFAMLMLAAAMGVRAQTLTVAPADATAPAKPTLTWDFAGGSGCTSTGNWSGAKAATGTVTLGDFPAGTHTFTLSCSFPGALTDTKATLTWTPPTQNTDGSALTNLASYRVKYGTSSASLTQMQTVTAPASTAIVSNLTAGTWYFGATAVNSAGAESALSNIGTKTIAAPPPTTVSRTVTWTVKAPSVPNPPTNLTVVDMTAYEIKTNSTGTLTATRVGVVPTGTVCDPQRQQKVGVVTYWRIPRQAVDLVSWPSSVKLQDIYAKCG